MTLALAAARCAADPSSPESRAPVAIAYAGHGRLLVLDAAGKTALLVDIDSGATVRAIALPEQPAGAVLRGDIAYVTTLEPAGRVLAVDLVRGDVRREWPAGHMPAAPAISPDGQTLCVANRFENRVRFIDIATGTQRTLGVVREPAAIAFSPDGRLVLVANLLPEVTPGLDDENPDIAAEVSVIDARGFSAAGSIRLPNGSHSLRGIAFSPDGARALVTHILSNYMPPPLSPSNGAIHMNVVSLLDVRALEWVRAIPLDEPGRGAGNPWAIAFSPDGDRLLVTHAGTHELSIIDYPKLLDRIASTPVPLPETRPAPTLLAGIRQRVPLAINGARSLAVDSRVACVAGFFSGTLAILDPTEAVARPRVIALGGGALRAARLGEALFNDASLCLEGWQSCASCHPDGRSDALYWDLMNDGTGNTKNTKSLLMSALISPVMWRGVRGDAAAAVRSGFHHILRSPSMPPGTQEAVLAYLREMPSVPSPFLDASRPEAPQAEEPSCAKCHRPSVPRGSLTEAARRGKALFEGKAGCAPCHPHPLYTTMGATDPGLGSGIDYRIPSLVEAWRTAPYLHSGDATSLRETITDFNFMHRRGRTQSLTPQELDDLVAYLRSL